MPQSCKRFIDAAPVFLNSIEDFDWGAFVTLNPCPRIDSLEVESSGIDEVGCCLGYPGRLRIPTIVTAHTDERDRCSVRASVVFRV